MLIRLPPVTLAMLITELYHLLSYLTHFHSSFLGTSNLLLSYE